MTRLRVLGNAGWDVGLAVPRLPRPGETLVGASQGMAPGGKGLNQAVVACRTGLVPVEFTAPLGPDVEGDRLAGLLHAEGFAGLHLPRPGPPTDCSVLLVMPGGENSIVTAGACAAALLPPAMPDVGGWLLLQGNLSAETTLAACNAARSAGAAVMLNTAPLPWDMRAVLPFCGVAVANRDEAQALTGETGERAATALHRAGATVAVLTLGAEGCLVADAGGVRAFPAPRVQALDTTGAGDTFCGVLAACLAVDRPLALGIDAAQRAAALAVQRPGCFHALPSAAELAAILAA